MGVLYTYSSQGTCVDKAPECRIVKNLWIELKAHPTSWMWLYLGMPAMYGHHEIKAKIGHDIKQPQPDDIAGKQSRNNKSVETLNLNLWWLPRIIHPWAFKWDSQSQLDQVSLLRFGKLFVWMLDMGPEFRQGNLGGNTVHCVVLCSQLVLKKCVNFCPFLLQCRVRKGTGTGVSMWQHTLGG